MAIQRNGSELAALTARAIDRLGSGDFYDRLLDILCSAAPHDLAALVRYSRAAPPDLILPRVEPNAAMLAYYHHFYAFDPFYAHWKGGGETGVFRLRAMDAGIGRSRYAREFLTAMAIHDEIAVFLPPIGEASPTLILDRAHGAFSAQEVARVRQLFPLLAALHRRHLSIFVTEGIDTGTSPIGHERPLRIVDQHGLTVFATAAWGAIAADPGSGLAEAAAMVAARGPCAVRLTGAQTLRRTQLPPDFGPAPGGFCDEVTPEPAPATEAAGLPPALARQLTEREQQVVLLTLQGYPVIEIARKLGLSRGTVKNYRLAIYRKLDITTERELFGEYMAAIRGQGLAPPLPGPA
jgi:DNA-binding CsgD family transcriptional regulator